MWWEEGSIWGRKGGQGGRKGDGGKQIMRKERWQVRCTVCALEREIIRRREREKIRIY
jgi:hypothetical protein